MAHPSTDARYLDYQYDDSNKLRIRTETHDRFTVGEEDFEATERRHLRLAAGQVVLDAGCGPGRLARGLVGPGVTVVGIDRSFGMLHEANAASGPAVRTTGSSPVHAATMHASFARADVVALPFADATFDRVASLGVLYHMRDWLAAVREMRRVCRPGGRIVISTNGRHTMQRLLDVHIEAARELGYVPLSPAADTLRLEDHEAVRDVLPGVECDVLESTLVFPTSAPALRFYATNRIDLIENRSIDGSHRPQLMTAVGRKIDAIIAREGVFSVPKTFGYFVADV